MTPRPVIFISAASRELKSARQLVANTLQFLGYEPEWQDVFGTEHGDLREMLRRRIDASAGVVQLIGQSYGAEPPEADPEFGRCSYTQYEALYARARGKRVWYLVLDEHFPSDAHDPEPEELRSLQAAYRQRFAQEHHLYHALIDRTALEATVLKLRDDLGQLRRGVKRWALAVIGLLIALTGAVVWQVQSQRQQTRTVGALVLRHAQIEQALVRLAEVESRQKEPGDKVTPEQQRARAYSVLEKDLGLPPGTLAQELPALALELYSRPDATTLLRARAAYALNKFEEAERLSLEAAEQENRALEKANQVAADRRRGVIDAFQLAGESAQKRAQFDDALRHFRAAEKLTDRERDPREWARLQRALAKVLDETGRYDESGEITRGALAWSRGKLGAADPDTLALWHGWATTLGRQSRFADAEKEFRALIPARERTLGAEHPDTLISRQNLATALSLLGKSADADAEDRAVLAIRERTLGPEHPDTLISRLDLASSLDDQGHYPEAEAEYRAVLAIQMRTLGAEDHDTLGSRSNLANALWRQGKHQEAEQENRTVLAIRSRIFGPEHPDALLSRIGLANALMGQKRYDQAEREFRVTLASQERVLGAQHPDSITARTNLGSCLLSQGKAAEAEREVRAVLAICEKSYDANHPSVLQSCGNLAEVLESQGKLDEALPLARRAEAGFKQIYGEEHPDFKEIESVREKIEAGLKKEKREP